MQLRGQRKKESKLLKLNSSKLKILKNHRNFNKTVSLHRYGINNIILVKKMLSIIKKSNLILREKIEKIILNLLKY